MLRSVVNGKWPSGNSQNIATLRISDSEVERSSGMTLKQGVESELGDWVAIGGQLPSGTDMELIRYIDAPDALADQFIVRVDKKANFEEALNEVLSFLKVSKELIAWKISDAAT